MKILKIKYCKESFMKCFYLRWSRVKLQYECSHPEIVKKLQNTKPITTWKMNNIKIPKWCPLESCIVTELTQRQYD